MKRILKALVAYGVVGTGVWFAVDPIRRVFLLPELFTTATRILVLVFLPLALATAWRYPHVGRGEDPPE